MSTDPCVLAGERLKRSSRVVVFTGAGISTESGIPDFRSPGGIWSRYDPAKLTFDRFRTDSETRRLYWDIAAESYQLFQSAEPNSAHRAVAAMEKSGRLLRIVTQNVDGLHQKAGNSDDITIEIHGTALKVGCIDCETYADPVAVHTLLAEGEREPVCESCSGFLKPATISFGQAMPERETAEAFAAAAVCDLMLVIGSSLVVYPAAGVPEQAVRSGAPLVIVNREPTPLDAQAEIVVHGAAGESMSRIAEVAGLE